VLQWITEHGEAFLAKYTGIGKTLPRATQLRKRHEDFEDVAQNTYTNAEKLLEAAEQLAQNGDCDPHEIFQVAALYLLSSRGAGTPPPVEFQRFAASSCEYISQKWVFALLFRCFSGSGETVVRNDITFCDGTTTTLNQTMKVSKNWFVVEKKQTFHVPLEKVTKICSRAFVEKITFRWNVERSRRRLPFAKTSLRLRRKNRITLKPFVVSYQLLVNYKGFRSGCARCSLPVWQQFHNVCFAETAAGSFRMKTCRGNFFCRKQSSKNELFWAA